MTEETSRLGAGAWRPSSPGLTWARSGPASLPRAQPGSEGGWWLRDAPAPPSIPASPLCLPFGLRWGVIITALCLGLHCDCDVLGNWGSLGICALGTAHAPQFSQAAPPNVLSHFSRVQLSVASWTVAARLLCPWDFPGKKTGVGCRFLLQGIFPAQGSNLCLLGLLYWQVGSLQLSHRGSPAPPKGRPKIKHCTEMVCSPTQRSLCPHPGLGG